VCPEIISRTIQYEGQRGRDGAAESGAKFGYASVRIEVTTSCDRSHKRPNVPATNVSRLIEDRRPSGAQATGLDG